MGDVEILIDEDGALKVVQHYDLRFLVRRLRPEGSERHRVFTWPHCGRALQSIPELSFNLVLRTMFQLFLLATLVWILVGSVQTGGSPHWWTLTQLSLLAAVLVLVAFEERVTKEVKKWVTVMKKACSTPPKREEVKTISGLIRHVLTVMKTTCSTPPKREEVTTISGLIQHV